MLGCAECMVGKFKKKLFVLQVLHLKSYIHMKIKQINTAFNVLEIMTKQIFASTVPNVLPRIDVKTDKGTFLKNLVSLDNFLLVNQCCRLRLKSMLHDSSCIKPFYMISSQPRSRFDIFLYGGSRDQCGTEREKACGKHSLGEELKKIRAPSRTDPASHRRERYQSAGNEADI